MIRKRLSIGLVALHLIIQLILSFISSLHWILLVLALITYATVLYKEFVHPTNSSLFCNHYLSSIIFTLIHYIFILTYNKILKWELGLVILFLLLILHYSRRLSVMIFKFDLTWSVDLVFSSSYQLYLINVHRMPIGRPQDCDSTTSIVIIKFLVTSLLFFGYTSQLCLTTVCTPSIYFNWFLIVNDCRYTYSNLL